MLDRRVVTHLVNGIANFADIQRSREFVEIQVHVGTACQAWRFSRIVAGYIGTEYVFRQGFCFREVEVALFIGIQTGTQHRGIRVGQIVLDIGPGIDSHPLSQHMRLASGIQQASVDADVHIFKVVCEGSGLCLLIVTR